MKIPKRISFLAGTMFMIASAVYAQSSAVSHAATNARDAGAPALWILANLGYAGMRAQNHPSAGWRALTFIFGLPGTLISWIVVVEGSERAYGIDIPKKRP